MTLLWLILALLAPACTGWFLLRTLWPTPPRHALLLRLTLALPLGLALASAHFLLWRFTSLPLGLLYRLSDCLLLPALALLAARIRTTPAALPPFDVQCSMLDSRCSTPTSLEPQPTSHLLTPSSSHPPLRRSVAPSLRRSAIPHFPIPHFLTCLLTLLASLCALTISAGYSFREPLGHWDAWAIWNLKARFLATPNPQWQNLFSNQIWFSHPDYPLLLPAAVARLWLYTATDSPLVPQLLALAYTALALALLFAAVSHLIGLIPACLATLLLASSEVYLYYGGLQLADIPLSLYLLASLTTLALAARSDRPMPLLLLTGLFAACAAFTKNEGLILIASLLPSAFLTARLIARTTPGQSAASPRLLSPFRTTLLLFTGILPLLLLLLTQKALFHTQTYLTADQPSSSAAFHNLTDPARHRLFLTTLCDWNFGTHDWKPIHDSHPLTIPRQPQLLLLLLLPFAAGLRPHPRDRFAIQTSLLTLTLCLAGYYIVLLILPYDLSLLLGSWPRYQSQLWPAFIFTLFLAVGPIPRQPIAISTKVEPEHSLASE